MSRLIKSTLAVTAIAAAAAAATSTYAVTGTGSVSATVVGALAVTETTPMSFGSFTAGDSSGTVGTDGIASTGIVHFGGQSDGVLAISGAAGESVRYQTTDNTFILTNQTGAGGETMNGTFNPTASIVDLDTSGNAAFTFEGQLNVGANQAEGNYTGTYEVTVNYSE